MKFILPLVAAVVLMSIGVLAAGPLRRGLETLQGDSADQAQGGPAAEADAADPGASGVTLYQSGMHPWIITTEPGNCPICGMKLEPIDPAKLTGEIAIDPIVAQNIGVRTSVAEIGPAVKTIRTVGTVEVAEPNVHDVNLRLSGWIEDLFVGYEGARVEVGDPLFSVYSPQLYAAAEEYLLAAEGPEQDRSLVDSARDRLLNLGLAEAQVEAIREAGEVQRSLTLLSPATGTVLSKHANAGMNVEPGMRVFRIVDLSTVWVQVTLYESQLQNVRTGQTATMTVAGLPGQTFVGELSFVDPSLDPMTRSVQARLVFENPGDRLKPGMFADVTLQDTLAEEALLIPAEAVVDTGTRKLVFVARGSGRFEPREVTTGGAVAGGRVRVASGLNAGESVVTSGQFLLDSEASVRSSLARMVAGPATAEQAGGSSPASAPTASPPITPPPTGSPPTASAPPEPVAPAAEAPPAAAMTADTQVQVDRLAEAYLGVHVALTGNRAEPVAPIAAAAAVLGREAEAVGDDELRSRAAAVRLAADRVPADADLPAIRDAFDALTLAVAALFDHAPPTPQPREPLALTHCPMVDKSWLQLGTSIRNPYDPSMLACGLVVRTIQAGGTDAR